MINNEISSSSKFVIYQIYFYNFPKDTKSNDLQSVKIVKNLNKIKQLSALICPLFDHTSLAVVSSLSDSNIPVLLPNARKENPKLLYQEEP